MTPLSDQDIYERMVSAILDHRLPPGTKLVEDRLAEAFGVSRPRIPPAPVPPPVPPPAIYALGTVTTLVSLLVIALALAAAAWLGRRSRRRA